MKGTYFIHHSDKTQIYKPECSGRWHVANKRGRSMASVFVYQTTLNSYRLLFPKLNRQMAGLSSAEGLFGKLNKKTASAWDSNAPKV